MISLGGLGKAGDGDVADDGDSAGVGAVLGVVITDGVASGEVVTSGEVVACWLSWVQPARIKTNPATHAAGTTPLLTGP